MSVSVTIKIIWHTYIKMGVVVRSLPKEKKGTYDDPTQKRSEGKPDAHMPEDLPDARKKEENCQKTK